MKNNVAIVSFCIHFIIFVQTAPNSHDERNHEPSDPVSVWKPEIDECPTWEEKCIPTVTDCPVFNINKTVDEIYWALRNGRFWLLVKIIPNLSLKQRLLLKPAYKELFGEELMDALKWRIGRGQLRTLLRALMKPLGDFYSYELKKSITGHNVKIPAIIEIIGTLSKKGIRAISHLYENSNDSMESTIVADIKSKTSENPEHRFANLLLSLISGDREEGARIFEYKVEDQVKRLIRAESEKDTDYLIFKKLLLESNNAHLRRVFQEFKKFTHHNLGESLARGNPDSIREVLIIMYKIINNRSEYFAELLRKSLDKPFFIPVDQRTIRRIIVGRSEIDLENIKAAYERKYNEPLSNLIMYKMWGPHRIALLNLIEEAKPSTVATNSPATSTTIGIIRGETPDNSPTSSTGSSPALPPPIQPLPPTSRTSASPTQHRLSSSPLKPSVLNRNDKGLLNLAPGPSTASTSTDPAKNRTIPVSEVPPKTTSTTSSNASTSRGQFITSSSKLDRFITSTNSSGLGRGQTSTLATTKTSHPRYVFPWERKSPEKLFMEDKSSTAVKVHFKY